MVQLVEAHKYPGLRYKVDLEEVYELGDAAVLSPSACWDVGYHVSQWSRNGLGLGNTYAYVISSLREQQLQEISSFCIFVLVAQHH